MARRPQSAGVPKVNPWDKQGAIRATDNEKLHERCLTRSDLARHDVMLFKFERYFEEGTECRRRIADCREVVQETSILWGKR